MIDIKNEINQALAKNNIKIKIDEKNLNLNLKDFGVDSISLMTVIVELENKLSIMLPDDELITIKTPKNLIDLIDKTLVKK